MTSPSPDRPDLPRLAGCRSLLFVPGNRPERFAKAAASGADAVALDCEDAVAAAAKPAARWAIMAEVDRSGRSGGPLLGVRINSLRGPDGLQDLLALTALQRMPDFIILSKVEAAAELSIAADNLAGRSPRFIALVETARGVEDAALIAQALPAPLLAGLFFGGLDYAASIGCTQASATMAAARSRVVQAARLGGLSAIDAPSQDARDASVVEAEARQAAESGFDAKAAIHPAQVAPIHRAFAPAEAEIVRARRLVEAYEQAGGGVALLEGRLVERPVYIAAMKILARAARGALSA